MLTRQQVNAGVFIEFLRRLIHNAQKPVFVILDGHSVHRSRQVREYVESWKGKLQLFFLPPYAPELNPDEQVWNHVKHHGVGKAALRTGRDLARFVIGRLRSLQRLPWTVRMFFLTPDAVDCLGAEVGAWNLPARNWTTKARVSGETPSHSGYVGEHVTVPPF